MDGSRLTSPTVMTRSRPDAARDPSDSGAQASPADARAKAVGIASGAALDAADCSSPDPLRCTDRYRLVMPFTERLREQL